MRSVTSRKSYSSEKTEKPNIVLSECRLSLIGLIFSLIVITLKIVNANWDNMQYVIFEKEWKAYETVITDGEVVVRHTWVSVLKYSWFWFPILCGSLATWFTGLMVYIDSSEPGVQPPSPLSSSKYKAQFGHSFHLNYVFAVIIGLLVSGYMFMRGSKLEI